MQERGEDGAEEDMHHFSCVCLQDPTSPSPNKAQWSLCDNKIVLAVIPNQRNGHSSYIPFQNKPISPLPWQSRPEWAPLRPPRPALFPFSVPAVAEPHSGAARCWSAPLRPDSPHPPPRHPPQHLRRCETSCTNHHANFEHMLLSFNTTRKCNFLNCTILSCL